MVGQPNRSAVYVFLSYASTDREQALAIADLLNDVGIQAWVDRRSLVGGMSWDAAIVEAIKTCSVFAVLCSPAGVTSPNVMQELRLAWEEQRPTLPLRLAEVSFPSEMRYILAGRQWVDVLDRPEAAWLRDLLQALAGLGVLASPSVSTAESVAAPVVEESPSNLPSSPSSFVGREQELAEAVSLLQTARLVTLTGPGGTGKTRLALEAATLVRTHFPDGTWFVDLSALTDPALLTTAIAQLLDVRLVEGRTLDQALAGYLREKRLLLVLDNLEQLVEGTPQIGGLLAASPGVTALATSRVPLRLRIERELPVPPLALPPSGAPAVAEAAAFAAVTLFVERAQAVRRDFRLTVDNAAAVVALCRALDGLPLAIELAAARIKVLSPQALLERIGEWLQLLASRNRDAPARQQTLRSTIAWSYDLLTPEEQPLFRRLAVFAGGCTLAAAEAVCDPERRFAAPVLDVLESLLDKSLLVEREAAGGETRFGMLSLILDFAREQLAASGEQDELQERHAVYFRGQTASGGTDRAQWGHERRLEAEQENFRAALARHVERGETERGLSLAAALGWWFFARSQPEGRRWLEQLLALPGAERPTRARIRALSSLGLLLFWAGDLAGARERQAEAVRLSRELHETRLLGHALAGLASAGGPSETEAVAAGEEAVALLREIGDQAGIASALNALGLSAIRAGDYPRARSAFEEGLVFERARAGETELVATLVSNIAALDSREGRFEAAAAGFRASVATYRRLGEGATLARGLLGLGQMLTELRELDGAGASLREGLELSMRLQTPADPIRALRSFAMLAVKDGNPLRAARLFGAGTFLQTTAGVPEIPHMLERFRFYEAETRAALGEEQFRAAWSAGERLSLDQAVALALEERGGSGG